MPGKRSVRFVDVEAAETVASIEVDDVVLVKGGDPQDLTEDQHRRAKAVAPTGALKVDTNQGSKPSKEE